VGQAGHRTAAFIGIRLAAVVVLLVAAAAAQAESPGACQDSHHAAAPSDATVSADRQIWKTITLGSYASARELRQALRAAACGIGELAGEMLYRPAFKVSETPMEVDLVVRSVGALGFDADGASLADIYTRARGLGLELCPHEVAPQLRLQYLDQPLGEFLHIAMEPAVAPSGDVAYFILGNGGAGLMIIAGSVPAEVKLAPAVRFVFVRPRMVADPR
jgi:hypothetical protein